MQRLARIVLVAVAPAAAHNGYSLSCTGGAQFAGTRESVLDPSNPEIAKLASLAKCKVGETFHTVSREGIQMHGGIGMTDEFDIGFFIKRAAVKQFHRGPFPRPSIGPPSYPRPTQGS